MGWLNIAVLVVMLMMTINTDYTEACSCTQPHLQNNYCDADFVMLGRLRGEGEYIYKKTLVQVENKTEPVEYRHPIDLKYSVKILKLFKGEHDGVLSKNSTVAAIHTPPIDGMCKVDLDLRTKYLLTGKIIDNELWINLCTWGLPWPLVTKQQKKYLRFTYESNCECKPKSSLSRKGLFEDDNMCYWRSSTSDGKCFQRHSACIVDKNSSTGGCKWHRNQRVRQCREELKLAKFSILP